MRFLLPMGGVVDHRFGIITTPGKYGVPAGIKAGMAWAADNEAFQGKFDPDRFFEWLERMRPYRQTCLFVTCPDSVGDPVETRRLFDLYRPRFGDWPVAFVAQDGQENLDFPPPELWHTLFVGGSSGWKDSSRAVMCIQKAQALGKKIHIGRVNWRRRYDLFDQLPGSEEFTCDGTRVRYDGKERTLRDWAKYQDSERQLRHPLLSRYSGR